MPPLAISCRLTSRESSKSACTGGRGRADELVVEHLRGGAVAGRLAGRRAAVENEQPVGVDREDELVGDDVAVRGPLRAGKLGSGNRRGEPELVEEVAETRAFRVGAVLAAGDSVGAGTSPHAVAISTIPIRAHVQSRFIAVS